jgi:hypothetical protein
MGKLAVTSTVFVMMTKMATVNLRRTENGKYNYDKNLLKYVPCKFRPLLPSSMV